MWIELFTVVTAIAIGLAVGAVALESSPKRKAVGLVFQWFGKRLSSDFGRAASRPPDFFLRGAPSVAELVQLIGGHAAPDVEALCAAVRLPVLRGVQR